MKKQFTILLSLLALSTSLVACTSNNATEEIIVSEENITSDKEVNTSDTEVATDVETEENIENNVNNIGEVAPESAENVTESTEETKNETSQIESSSAPNSTTQTENLTKPEASTKPNTTNKPQPSTKPSTTTKPQASTKPSTTTKPQASSKPSTTTKPEASSKPSTTTKPEASSKPSTKPETAPTPSPSAPATNTTSLSCSTIFDKILNGIDTSNMQTVDAQLLNDFYGIDSSLLEDFCVKMPMMSFSITEVGVFKVKDTNNIDSVVSSINKRASDIGISLYPSLEETYANKKIVTKGQYILFAISDDADAIVSNFNALF